MPQSPENQVFEFQKAQLHYHRTGKGKKIILAFHGFGQTKQHLYHFANAFKDTHTVFSFDLFYHGMSFWHEREKPLTKTFWINLMEAFCNFEGITSFSLAGYSMGSKFALATLEAFPERVEQLILMAPDGIKTSFWYSLATYPQPLRKFFRGLVINPKPFYALTGTLSKLNMLDRGILKFAQSQMNSREKRRRVYYSWVVFRLLKFDIKKVATVINQHNVKVSIFLGKYDKIITEQNMKKLVDNLENYEVHILESGHNSLIDAVAEYYEKN